MIFVPNQIYCPCNGFTSYPQSNSVNSESMQRSRFTKEEDELLKQLVNTTKQVKWSEIAQRLPNRTARQCRERYNNYLKPSLINGPWSKEEDELLIELYEKYGPKWALISKSFNARSSVNVKNHYSSLASHSNMKNNQNNKKIDNFFTENDNQKLTENNEKTTINVEYTPNNETNIQNEQIDTLTDELYENMFQSFEINDELWTNSLVQLPEDDLFVF